PAAAAPAAPALAGRPRGALPSGHTGDVPAGVTRARTSVQETCFAPPTFGLLRILRTRRALVLESLAYGTNWPSCSAPRRVHGCGRPTGCSGPSVPPDQRPQPVPLSTWMD